MALTKDWVNVDSNFRLGYTFILLIPLIHKEPKWKKH